VNFRSIFDKFSFAESAIVVFKIRRYEIDPKSLGSPKNIEILNINTALKKTI